MPLEMFFRLDGIQGDSRNYQHKGWSDVISWHWGMSSNIDSSSKRNTSFDEITITKNIGIDSAAIMLLFSEGRTIESAELNVIPVVAKREAKQKYVYIKLEGVTIKSIDTGGSTEDNAFQEHLVLNFTGVRFVYNPHFSADPDNPTASVTDYNFAWDIKTNTGL